MTKTHESDDTDIAVIADLVSQLAKSIEELAGEASPGRRARMKEVVYDVTKELRRVAERPDEPMNCHVVMFIKRWGGGRAYRYAAAKVEFGVWRVTGRTDDFTWDSLLDFIERTEPKALATLRYCVGTERRS